MLTILEVDVLRDTHEVITTLDRFDEVIQELDDYAHLKDKMWAALDFETQWLITPKDGAPRPIRLKDGRKEGGARLMQIGLDPFWDNKVYRREYDRQYVFELQKLQMEYLHGDVKLYIGEKLKPIFKRLTIIGHNLKYEFQYLISDFGLYHDNFRDTMLISQILNAGRHEFKHGLGKVYARTLPWGWFKDYTRCEKFPTGMSFKEYDDHKIVMQKSDWSVSDLSEEQIVYSVDDVRLIFWVWYSLLDEITDFIRAYERRNSEGQSIYKTIWLENALIPVYGMMELRGFKFDREYYEGYVVPSLEMHRDEALEHITLTRTCSEEITEWVYETNEKGKTVRVFDITPEGKKKFRKKVVDVRIWEEKINVNSPKHQLRPALEALLGITFPDGVGEDELKKFTNRECELRYGKEAIDQIRWILQYKEASSYLSKFGEKLLSPTYLTDLDYIHGNIFQMGRDDDKNISTGRSSMQDPNLQQMPSRGDLFGWWNKEDAISVIKFFRTGFIAEKGFKLVQADYSQIEPRFTAFCTQDETLVEAFNSSEDVDYHALTAQGLLGLPEPPKKGSFERDYIGKTANLALSYGAGPQKLAMFIYENTLHLPEPIKWTDKEAKAKYDSYFQSFPGIANTMEEYKEKVSRLPMELESLLPFAGRKPFAVTFTLMGRPRLFCLSEKQEEMADSSPERLHRWFKVMRRDGSMGFWNEFHQRLNDAARKAYNSLIQGSSADALKIGLLNVHNRMLEEGFDLWTEGPILVVHDEIISQAKEERAELAARIMKEEMIASGATTQSYGPKSNKTIPIVVKPLIVDNWAECK